MSVKVICNRVSGKSKGYGFVHFATENAARNALKEMDGKVKIYQLMLPPICKG